MVGPLRATQGVEHRGKIIVQRIQLEKNWVPIANSWIEDLSLMYPVARNTRLTQTAAYHAKLAYLAVVLFLPIPLSPPLQPTSGTETMAINIKTTHIFLLTIFMSIPSIVDKVVRPTCPINPKHQDKKPRLTRWSNQIKPVIDAVLINSADRLPTHPNQEIDIDQLMDRFKIAILNRSNL